MIVDLGAAPAGQLLATTAGKALNVADIVFGQWPEVEGVAFSHNDTSVVVVPTDTVVDVLDRWHAASGPRHAAEVVT